MKKEIIVAVVTALLVSLVTWIVTTSKDELSKVQLKTIADNIIKNDSFMSILLDEFKKKNEFQVQDSSCSCKYDFDSGWIADTKLENHSLKIRHNLKKIPANISLWFTTDPKGNNAFPILWGWKVEHSGNPVTIEVTINDVMIHIWSGTYLHGVWSPKNEWQQFDSGFWRVYAWK